MDAQARFDDPEDDAEMWPCKHCGDLICQVGDGPWLDGDGHEGCAVNVDGPHEVP